MGEESGHFDAQSSEEPFAMEAGEADDFTAPDANRFVRLAPILFCLLDRQGRIKRTSRNAPQILGWTGAKLAGHDIADLTHPEDRDRLGVALANVGEGTETVVFEIRLCDQDNQWRPIAWRISARGDVVHAAAWPADSGDVKTERQQLLEAALTATTEGVVITDRLGLIEWVSPAFTRLTGYDAEEVIGRTPALLKSGAHSEEFYREMWDTITAGRNWTGQFVNQRKDGSHYDERASITPVRNARGNIMHFVAIKEDITEQLRREKLALRSQRVESLGLLAGGVAHDLNNLLAPILMAIDVLAEEDNPAERAELVETLRRNCERGRNIVRQVLTFARGIEGHRVAVQVRHLVKDMVKVAGEVFPKNIVVNNMTPRELWPVRGDPTQLHQVLLNLCLNARDAMPEGGAITICGANETLAEPKTFRDQTIPAGRYIHLSVADTGCGMSGESLARAFEPWYTTKEQGKGTGIGLPTSLGIIRTHHGLLTAESSPGQGATFHFWLPAIRDAGAATPPERPAATTGRGQTILVVDDEPPILMVFARVLKRRGYRVLTARNGAEGLAAWSKNPGAIDLVLTDILMPEMSGVEMISALRATDPTVPIIGLTGGLNDSDAASPLPALRKLGIETLLSKPIEVDELLRAIAKKLPDAANPSPSP